MSYVIPGMAEVYEGIPQRLPRWVQEHGTDRDVLEFQAVSMALDLAGHAHGVTGAKYGNQDYIWHPAEVARRCYEAGLGHTAEIVAMLHDTLEDTRLSPWVIGDTFGPEVREAVQALTRWPHKGYDKDGWKAYERYLTEQVCPNPLARAVKRQDLYANLARGSRTKYELALRLLDRYEAAPHPRAVEAPAP